MSSAPLYLAIVVVWLIVLVPMLLRKDSAETAYDDLRREDEDAGAPEVAEEVEEAEHGSEGLPVDEETPDLTETRVMTRPGLSGEHTAAEEAPERERRPAEPRPRPRPAGESRARVIARRRRRTSVLTLLNIATVVAVAFGLGPWWVVAPPVLLLTGHLALLREAAKADAERREARVRARRQAVLRARARAEEAREAEQEAEREAERKAEVIALIERRSQVYDQYADARLRAAGD
ncbi:divisome protein SepX/GlpR [Nocardiopsis terrae]